MISAAFKNVLARSFSKGIRQGFRSSLELALIMVPISLAVTLLQWAGLLDRLSLVVAPLFRWFGLPGSASLAFLTGTLVSCYSAIAVMLTLPLEPREITILALMILISHNVPTETLIQKRAGSSGLFLVALRLGMAFLTAAALNRILPGGDSGAAPSGPAAGAAVQPALTAMLYTWGGSQVVLIGKITLIVMALTVFCRFLDESGAARYITAALLPLLKIMGLSGESAFLWVVANTLGLAYGAAIILGEKAEGKISDREIRRLNVSVALCHSLLEDTILFAAIGASAIWIVFPRLLIAGLSVWAYRWLIEGKIKNGSAKRSSP